MLSAAVDESVARGMFRALPTTDATTRPTKEDGTAFVKSGSIWTIEKHKADIATQGTSAPVVAAARNTDACDSKRLWDVEMADKLQQKSKISFYDSIRQSHINPSPLRKPEST